MANYGSNLRRMFGNSTRKVRKNAGVKRGPRKPRMLGPTNVVIVNAGGMANVVAAPGPKKTAGRTVGPRFIGPLRPQNVRRARKVRSNAGVRRMTMSPMGLAGMKIVGQRKTRKNKGVKRGPRTLGLRSLFG